LNEFCDRVYLLFFLNFSAAKIFSAFMVPGAEAFKKERPDKEGRSIGKMN
jgi:hypothetical protein